MQLRTVHDTDGAVRGGPSRATNKPTLGFPAATALSIWAWRLNPGVAYIRIHLDPIRSDEELAKGTGGTEQHALCTVTSWFPRIALSL